MTPVPIILIVDDNHANLFTIEELLATENYQLVLVDNGPEALEKAQHVTPDLIILDVMMPGMDGFAVCTRLRQTPHLAEVPILMLTILSERDYLLRGLQVGADDFITKPFDPLELRARIKSILRLNRYRKLVHERRRFRWVLEQAEDGYVLLDAQHQLTYANPQARLLLGLPEDTAEWNSRSFMAWATLHYQPQPQDSWDQWPHLPPHEPLYLIRPQSAQAPALWLEINFLEDVSVAEDAVYLLKLQDVTHRLTSAYSQWTLQRVISHKMRTPLIGMFSGLDLLRGNLDNFSHAEIRELVDMGYASAAVMKNNVDDIVRYIELPRLTLTQDQLLEIGHLPSMVQELAAEMQITAVDIHTTAVPLTQLIQLPLIASRLILHELLDNAQRFHPQHTPHITVTITAEAHHLIITVADDGQHLPVEQLARVWKPYYQAEKGFTGQTPGMGLGLALVAMLVWQAGGSCTMSNQQKGQGVVVEITLPFYRPLV